MSSFIFYEAINHLSNVLVWPFQYTLSSLSKSIFYPHFFFSFTFYYSLRGISKKQYVTLTISNRTSALFFKKVNPSKSSYKSTLWNCSYRMIFQHIRSAMMLACKCTTRTDDCTNLLVCSRRLLPDNIFIGKLNGNISSNMFAMNRISSAVALGKRLLCLYLIFASMRNACGKKWFLR